MNTRRIVVPIALAALIAPLAATADSAASSVPHHQGARGTSSGTPGSPDSGDSLFPHQGNGGYNVLHYGIVLNFSRPDTIHATTTVTAVATQDLSAFNLDFYKLKIDSIRVNGERTVFTRSGSELTITPRTSIATGARFSVAVKYHGTPRTYIDPDGSQDGWVKTRDGATVVSEPVGSMSWFPNNDTPRDKATYNIEVIAPKGLTVASNGKLVDRAGTPAGKVAWTWREHTPMATYLASVSIGKYDVTLAKTSAGIPIRSYVDPTLGGRKSLAPVGRVVTYWTKLFGPYPFESTGAIIDNTNVGYALEVQTRPIFTGPPDIITLVHELAHQWFGDSVTPSDWSDIWLNEGFATYAQWLWIAKQQHHPTAPYKAFKRAYDNIPRSSSFWKIPVAEPGKPQNMFGSNVYLKGAMALEALRLRIGSPDFFRLLKRWTHLYGGANATTADLLAVGEQVSGVNLDTWSNKWLHSTRKPRGY